MADLRICKEEMDNDRDSAHVRARLLKVRSCRLAQVYVWVALSARCKADGGGGAGVDSDGQ